MSMTAPEIGELVRVRGQHWVVADVHGPDRSVVDGQTLVDLLSVSDGGYGDELQVIWEVEPGREVLAAQTLPGRHPGWVRLSAPARRIPRRDPLERRRPPPTRGGCRRRSGPG